MDFFKVKKFMKVCKPNPEKDSDDKHMPKPDEPRLENGVSDLSKSAGADAAAAPAAEVEDEDDDDFILNEVKRRMKELRRNSFMVLIPEEESCQEEEQDEECGEMSSSDWREVEAEGRQWWCGFDAVYDRYCERMLFFDRISSQQLYEAGAHTPSTPSPRSVSQKLTSPLSCLSLRKIEEPEHLQQLETGPYQDLEIAYVAQICLTWEALHCQYTQLCQKIYCQPENPTCYNHSAQQFQQFQVLLQRFIENEPFQQGLRAEIYARTRNHQAKLLQVPNIQASTQTEMGEEDSGLQVLAPDLIRTIESSILTFHLFLKMDKRKSSGVLNLFGNQRQISTLQHSLEKKEMKLKELQKKKVWKKKLWPQSYEEVQLLFSLMDIKVMSRVLRMIRISKEQLFWCEQKMKKLQFLDGKLQRDSPPILFPC